MIEDKTGQRIPDVTFHTRENDEWLDVTTSELFDNKTIIVFSLPGAFTPTCSTTHLPRYQELQPIFKANGVDDIICVSVNDTFVMNAWKADQNADRIRFIPDGSGKFTDGMGMLVNKDDLGFGMRSWRYSMLVKNGVVEKMFIEPNKPGDPFEVSDADTMLNYLAPEAKKPQHITIVSKPGCGHCARAKAALKAANKDFETIELGANGLSLATLSALSGSGATPQVFVDGQLIGGADETVAWLAGQ